MIKNIKERIVGAAGSISGVASILGSWQLCHSICLGLITLLSLIGISVVGMPLLFLTKIAVQIWLFAVALLAITAVLYIKKKCISLKMIIFNIGVIIAGVPFKPLQGTIFVWVIGGLIASIAIVLFIKDKMKKSSGKVRK